MKSIIIPLIATFGTLTVASCQNATHQPKPENITQSDTIKTKVDSLVLPEPYATPAVAKYSKTIGWPADKTPIALDGFTVTKFADGLDNPRNIYVADNGDVFVAESNGQKGWHALLPGQKPSADRITRFSNFKNGVPMEKSIYLQHLSQPFGMLIIGNKFYVGNSDGVVVYPYDPAASSINVEGKKIVSLPTGGHWTRNIISNANGDKIFISVGSSSNIAEKGMEREAGRACILEINTDGSGEKIYASGLRNPVGMGWAPGTQTLWTAVNERDNLGDELVPDYLTSVKKDGFYGWPYSYWGQHKDPRLEDKQRPDLVNKAITPDVSLGSHTASLGLAFYTGKSFPEKYDGGVFIAQHGSWNRSVFAGYKVVFIPFKNGKPGGKPEDFLTGFIADESKSQVYGRPVEVAILKDGSLLLADDEGNTIWRIAAK
jgi:glucose/arabinose dehydrogenase